MKTTKGKIFALLAIIIVAITIVLLKTVIQQREAIKLAGGDISKSFYEKLRSTGEGQTSVFFKKADPASQLETQEIKIDLLDFIEVVKSLNETQGIIIKPALMEVASNLIVYTMIPFDTATQQKAEDSMYILNTDLTDYGALDNYKVKYNDGYYSNYINTVKSVEYDIQYKQPSRFYSKPELVEMLVRRGVFIYNADLSEYKNWRLYINGAAIVYEDIAHLKLYYPTHRPPGYPMEYHIGFTTMLRVRTPYSFVGLAYEIGNPCPPRCVN